MASLEKAGYLADVLGCAIMLADIRIAQGRLRRRPEHLPAGIAAGRAGESRPCCGERRTCTSGMSPAARERNELEAARRQLPASQELGEHAGLPQNRYRWRVAMARIRQAEGDPAGAVELLDEAEQLYAGDFSPDVRPVPALRARVLGRSGPVG